MDVTTSTEIVSALDLVNLSNSLAQLNLGYLGISVGIFVLLGGVFVYFNIKPLQDSLEKQSSSIEGLKKEAQEILEVSRKESGALLESFRKNQTEAMSALLSQESEKLLSQVESKVTAFDRDIAKKVDDVAEQKYSKLREVLLSDTKNQLGLLEKSLLAEMNKLKINLEKEISATNTSEKLLNRSLKDIERRIKELELEEFARKNQMGSIYRAIDLLREDIDENDDSSISRSLERLQKQIEGVALKADDITDIEEQLTRLDKQPKYKIFVDKVRGHYNDQKGEGARSSA